MRTNPLSNGTIAAAGAWVAAVAWTVWNLILGASGIVWVSLIIGSLAALLALQARLGLFRSVGLVLAAVGLALFAVISASTGWFLLPAVMLAALAAVQALLYGAASPAPRHAA